jgi:hypothetical protein
VQDYLFKFYTRFKKHFLHLSIYLTNSFNSTNSPFPIGTSLGFLFHLSDSSSVSRLTSTQSFSLVCAMVFLYKRNNVGKGGKQRFSKANYKAVKGEISKAVRVTRAHLLFRTPNTTSRSSFLSFIGLLRFFQGSVSPVFPKRK